MAKYFWSFMTGWEFGAVLIDVFTRNITGWTLIHIVLAGLATWFMVDAYSKEEEK